MNISSQGRPHAIEFIFKVLLRPGYRLFRLFFIRDKYHILNLIEIKVMPRLKEGLEVKPIDLDDHPELLERLPYDFPAIYKKFHRMPGNKYVLIGAFYKGAVVGTVWRISFNNSYQSWGGYSAVADRGIWVEAIWVDPQYRMKGIHIHLFSAVLEYARSQGLGCIYSEIDYYDAVKKVLLRLGFKAVCTVSYVDILGIRRLSIRPEESTGQPQTLWMLRSSVPGRK